ncbi:MAG: HD domain-containing protein [bacterium]|nr:HD domain-containing protein [bacterium]MDT8367094.1 HD domain-containing protein [bacterium]
MRLGLRVFLVGGAVRDILEERSFSGEWDVVVFGGGDEGAKRLAGEVSRARRVGDPVSFPRFGTHLVYGAASRIEFAQAHLRSSLTCICSDPLTADALSRDFTLNALYVEIAEPEHSKAGPFDTVDILDPGGRGLADIKEGLLRTPIGARRTFEDDPLRIFRAARLRASKSYRIDPPLGKAARHLSVRVSQVAPERILDEMNLILLSERPSLGLELLGRWNALDGIMPEVQAMVGFRQNNPFHFPDLFRHTLRVVDRCPGDLSLRWAALLHDCGKPAAMVPSENGDSYHGHESMGSELAEKLLKRLKAGKKLTREVGELVLLHMVHYTDEWSDRAVRRFIHRAGGHLDRLLALVEADSASLRLYKGKLQDLGKLRKRVETIRGTMPKPRSPLTGQQIMEILDIEPGLSVGEAKKALVEAVVEGDIPPEEDAARRFLEEWYSGSSRKT